MTEKNSFGPKYHGCVFFCSEGLVMTKNEDPPLQSSKRTQVPASEASILRIHCPYTMQIPVPPLQKKDTSVTFWAERNFFCHTYDTSMTIIVTKPGIIIDVVGSYFYDKKS